MTAMALSSELPDRAKRFRIFKNGDQRFLGKEFVLNKRRVRNWDSFLQQVTNDTRASEAIRSIRTPVGGTRVLQLEDLEDSKNYVAVGNTRFNPKIRYMELESLNKRNNNSPLSPRNFQVKPVEHSRIQASGRIRKIPTDVITIYVYCNGNELQQAKRVTLTRSMLQKWNVILQEITDKVGLLATSLYTPEGVRITDPATLQKNNFYVAVNKRFKRLEYGSLRPGFNCSPKQRRRLDPIMAPTRKGRKLRTGSDQMENSASSTTSEKSPKSLRSNPVHNRPPPSRKPKQPTKEKEETVFHAKPVKHKRNDKELDLDKDEGGIFKAKGSNRATRDAQEVEETRDTQVDLPIDQIEAEEVQEEALSEDDGAAVPSDQELTKRPSDSSSTKQLTTHNNTTQNTTQNPNKPETSTKSTKNSDSET